MGSKAWGLASTLRSREIWGYLNYCVSGALAQSGLDHMVNRFGGHKYPKTSQGPQPSPPTFTTYYPKGSCISAPEICGFFHGDSTLSKPRSIALRSGERMYTELPPVTLTSLLADCPDSGLTSGCCGAVTAAHMLVGIAVV